MKHIADANKMVGEDHIRDATKMVSDTPRTDAGLEYDDTTVDDVKDFARQLERELNAANDRIKRLEEAGDAMASAWDKEWLMEADIEAIMDDWHGAKEAKP